MESRLRKQQAFQYKYLFESPEDKECLDLLFANVDDPNETIESIINYIIAGSGAFRGLESWEDFLKALKEQANPQEKSTQGKEISVMSWRKFKRIVRKSVETDKMFNDDVDISRIDVDIESAKALINKVRYTITAIM